MSDARWPLTGPRIHLRPGRPEDRAAVADVFACDGVRRWWGSQDDEDIDEMVAHAESDTDVDPDTDTGTDADTTVLMIDLGGAVIGVVQFHEERDPQYRHAGIDVAIHDDHQRQGFGPEAVGLVVDHLASLGHHRVVIDPNASNRAAIKAYERVGFAPVGVMRRYEWSEAEGRWTDGLLMELLIDERPTRIGDGGG